MSDTVENVLSEARDPRDCQCHGRPHLQCPNYNPELFGHTPFDPHVDVKPRAGLYGRAVIRVNWSLART